MKKITILCLVLLCATLMQAQNRSYSIDYSYESFSGCNIFSSAKTVDNFKHESTIGFPSFIANPDYVIVLPCKEVSQTNVLGTEYQILFPFKKGFKYQVNVQFKGSGGAGPGNGSGFPTLALKLNENGKPINSSTSCTGPKAILPAGYYTGYAISGSSLAWPVSPIINTGPLDKDYQSLTLTSLPSFQQTNQLNIFIRAISILEIPPPPSNPYTLLAYYKFNNNWNDNSGNNLTISPYYSSFACDGADALSAGFYGNSILTVPQSSKLYPSTSHFYLSCWISPSNVQGIKALAHSQNGDGWNQGWRMLLLDNTFNGRIITSQGAVDIYIGGIQANAWNHVGMSYDGNSLKGYLNGNLVTSTPIGGYLLTGAPLNMRLGYSNGDNYYYYGLIDEFKFYDGNMSDQEILQDYQATKSAIENPPPCPLRMFEQDITRHKPACSPLVSISPNPANSLVVIKVVSDENAGSSNRKISPGKPVVSSSSITAVKILDGAGTVVKQVRYSNASQQVTVDVTTLPSGIYYFQVFDGVTYSTEKVVIQH